jgi:hypothetical protein
MRQPNPTPVDAVHVAGQLGHRLSEREGLAETST